MKINWFLFKAKIQRIDHGFNFFGFWSFNAFLPALLIFLTISIAPARLRAQGFSSITNLSPQASTKNTGEKPQSKVWTYDGKWWTVFPNSNGTFLWRLDGTSWTSVLRVSTSTTIKADCKLVGNLVHVLLWKTGTSQLVSLEYVPSSYNYKLWTKRTSAVSVTLETGVEIATIDIDGNGRMWLASDGTSDVRVRWSDSPYSTWSAPIIIATGITDDDISVITSLNGQGKVGVLWSNQNTKRFGFKTHKDGDDPNLWSTDELPASQYALDVGYGMADDHMNVAVASDGTLFCAVKTSYDTPGYPRISLLKRSPSGVWDNLYEVSSESGSTRPIVILNELNGKLKVIYVSEEGGGNILYRESATSNISFGSTQILMDGFYSNPTSTKNNYDSEIVILASDATSASNTSFVGVLASDSSPTIVLPDTPVLLSPANLANDVALNPVLTWSNSSNTTSYQVQVSDVSDFSSIIFDQSNVTSTSVQPGGLSNNTLYYWRVRSVNSFGSSAWSSVWSFSTISGIPSVPTLLNPVNLATEVDLNPLLSWYASTSASYYEVQVSLSSDFSSTVIDQTNLIATSVQLSELLNNTKYYWRVRAINLEYSSEWSVTWSFTTFSPNPSIPELLIPVNLATDVSLSPALSWNASANTNFYHVQVSNTSDFSSTVLDLSELTSTSVQLSDLFYNTTYYWRVRAFNLEGSSEWSSVWSFITTRLYPSIPTLIGPANMASEIVTNPTLIWDTSAHASSYQLQVSMNAEFTTITIDLNDLLNTSVQLDDLLNDVVYYWRVRAANTEGYSAWSAVWNFSTVQIPPSVPVLLTPVNEITGVSPITNLSWNASTGATSYLIQVSEFSDFSTIFIDAGNITTTSYQITGLSNGRIYYWRVLASNKAGNSDWSVVWSFTTISNDLVANWKLNEGSGTTLIDDSGFGNNAVTRGNPSWVPGVTTGGLALRLNGTNQFAIANDANSLDVSKAITVAAWIRPEKKASQYIIQKGLTVDGYTLSLLSTGKVSFQVNQITSGTYKLNSKGLYPADGVSWMHVAATYDGSVIKIYLNGVEDKSLVFKSPVLINMNTVPLAIGAKNDGAGRFMGAIDDVRVYNYALTGSQISELVSNPENSVRAASNLRTASDQINQDEQKTIMADFDMNIYPNPVDDVLSLEFQADPQKIYAISIVDVHGRTYFSTTTKVENNMAQINLSELRLNPGLHLMVIRSDEFSRAIKFIKN